MKRARSRRCCAGMCLAASRSRRRLELYLAHASLIMKNGRRRLQLRRLFLACVTVPLLLSGCRREHFPQYAPDFREFAYVTNGGSNTVTVLDLVNLRQDCVLQVGAEPSGITANPKRNEVYAVNSASGSVR